MGAPLRSELSAMIFTKATRRKDVKHTSKVRTSEAPTIGMAQVLELNDPISEPRRDQFVAEDAKEEQDDVEDMQKTRQATINLIGKARGLRSLRLLMCLLETGVDTKRVADFTSCYYLFPSNATKLLVSILFLIELIGWKALLAGLAVFVISLPLNIYASKTYADTQGELMTVRDRKMV